MLALPLVALASLTPVWAGGGRPAAAGALLLGPSALGWLLVPAVMLPAGVRVGVAALLCGVVALLWRRAGERDAEQARVRALHVAQAGLEARHEEALARLRAAEGAAARAVAAIGHRLRQPVYALRLFAASLGEQPLDPRAADLARRVDGSGQALSHDLETLLDLSRLESGTLHPEHEPVDVEDVVRRVSAALEPVAARRGLSLGHEIEVETGLRVDPTAVCSSGCCARSWAPPSSAPHRAA